LYGIQIWTDLSSVSSGITRVTDRQTNGQTDRIILVAIPRLHYMQRGKNVKFLETGICRQSKVFSSVYIILRIHGTTTENAVSLVGISCLIYMS